MKVREMTTNAFWKGESGIKGVVEDQGEAYKVSVYIKGSRVFDYSCSCTQGNSYQGMCRHCEALYNAYKEKAEREGEKPVVTSKEARTMIREYTNREVAKIVGAAVEGGIRIGVRLIVDFEGVKLEFFLGRERLYVIKDLAAFGGAVEQGTYVEYGKGLAFHHVPAAFDEESRPLLEFLLELVFVYCAHYEQLRGKGFFAPPLRRLNLSSGSRDRFFFLMRCRQLELEDGRGHKRMVTVREGNPELAVTVRKKGRDGLVVSMPPGLFVIRGERHVYVGEGEWIFCCDEACGAALGVFLEQLTGGVKNACQIEVNETDMPLFYERVLKRIAAYCTIDSGDIVLESYKPEELKARFEFDSLGPGEIVLKPILSYGDCSFQPVEDEKLPRTVCRDVPGEFKISRLIAKYFKYKEHATQYPAIRDDEDAVYSLLAQGMEEFMALGDVWLSESFRRLKALPMPKVTVGVKSDKGWLELTVDMDGMTGAELSGLLSGYRQKKRYYRLKTGEFLALDDQGLMTVARLMEALGAGKSGLSHPIRLPWYRALYLNEVLKEGKGISLYRDTLFKAVVRGMKSVEDSDFLVPPSLVCVLREYQKTGFRWLKTLDFYGFGGILADEMGLGKTLQVIALLLDEAGRGQGNPSLIVCPASLIYNWENEIRTFAPSLPVVTVTGTAGERKELLTGLYKNQVLITSYDLLKRDLSLYDGIDFRFQIIDEAQFIKNPLTQSARAVKAVTAASRFALTGTPVENRLSELWSIFDFLMPGFLFSYSRFKKEYELPVIKEEDDGALKRLHRMSGPFILRRMKKDVLKELPDKLETVVYSGFEKEQKDLYAANAWQLKEQLLKEEGASDTVAILAKLMRLRQLCCDPRLCYEDYRGGSAKLETCMDLIKNGVEGGHRLLVFSQFTSMLDILEKRIKKEGLAFCRLTGATPAKERIHMVNSFQEGGIPVFLISLRAGGTGLNLMAADMVIHYDPWWNAAAQNQATDRAHRIGQERQVTVFKLIARGTIEENILKLQDSKKDLADRIVTEGGISFSSLTREDVIDLL